MTNLNEGWGSDQCKENFQEDFSKFRSLVRSARSNFWAPVQLTLVDACHMTPSILPCKKGDYKGAGKTIKKPLNSSCLISQHMMATHQQMAN